MPQADRGHGLAVEEARELLFSVGKPENIQKASEEFYGRKQKGRMEGGHSLTIHRDFLSDLPAVLRVYIGCATHLYGDIENADLIKIHMRSGKVSLMRYDDFEGTPLPLLIERIKIKLREQEIDFFEYGDEFPPHPLFLKSKYIPVDYKNFKAQSKFDCAVSNLPWENIGVYGPSQKKIEEMLDMEKLKIKGFVLCKKKEGER